MNKGEIKTKSIFKRILSLMIINIMLISLFAPYSKVFAQGEYEENVTFKLSPEFNEASIMPGGSVDVYMYITANRAVNGIDGTLVVDEQFEKVTLKDIEINENYIIPEGCPDAGTALGNNAYNCDEDQFVQLATKKATHNSFYSTYLAKITLHAKEGIPNITSFTMGIQDAWIYFNDGSNPKQTDDVSFSNQIKLTSSTHTLTYDYTTTGGAAPTGATPTVDVAEGQTITLPKDGVPPTGYTHVGWSTEPTITNPVTDIIESYTMGTEDDTLYAVYRKDLEIEFHYYDGKEKTYIPQIVPLYNKETSTTIQAPTLTNNYDSSEEGAQAKIWERMGWTTSEGKAPIATATMEPTSTIITEGTNVEVSESANYYMLYKRNISVSYDINEGDGGTVPSPQSGIVSTNTYDVTNITGAELVMPTNVPTKTGYGFGEWNTKADGTGTSYEKSTVAETKTGTFTDDTILYAKWIERGDTPYQVKHYKQKVRINEAGEPETYYEDGMEINEGETTPTYNAENDHPTKTQTPAPTGAIGFTVYATPETYPGYTLDEAKSIKSGKVINPAEGEEGLVLKLYYTANNNTPYTVEHYIQKVKEDGTTLYYADGTEEGVAKAPDNTQNLTGITGQQITAIPENHPGYELDIDKSVQTGTIKIDEAGKTLVLKLYYKAKQNINKEVYHIKQKPDGTYDEFTFGGTLTPYMEKETLTGTTGTKAIATPKTYQGYTYDPDDSTAEGTFWENEQGGNPLILHYTANAETPYKVEHYRQKDNGEYEELTSGATEYKDVEELTGITGKRVSATAKTQITDERYAGYIETLHDNRVVNATIEGDGSTVLRLYYKKAIAVTYSLQAEDASLPEGTPNPKEYDYGQSYGELPEPTREGYNFKGWYKTQAELTDPEAVALTADDIVTTSHIIYAKWEEKVYTITLDFNGGKLLDAEGNPVKNEDGTDKTTAELKINHFGQYAGLPTLTPPEGQEFKGWVNTLDEYATDIKTVENGDDLITKADHTLYAKWRNQEHTVRFIRQHDGVQVGKAIKVPHGTKPVTADMFKAQGVNLEDILCDYNTPEFYYQYESYQTYKLLFGTDTIKKNGIIEDTDVEITYTKITNRYTVTFYDEDKETKLDKKTVDYGGRVSTGVVPTKTADKTNTYAFEKWVDADGNTDDLSNVIADRNVYAYYKPTYINYTITFKDDDDTQISTKADYHYKDTITAPADPEKEATVSHKYTFAGWYDIEDEEQTLVNFEEATVAKNTTYKAKYNEELRKYKITYYDEKIGEQEPRKIAELETEYGKPANQPETPTKPDKDGKCYEFAGWVDEEKNPVDLSTVTGEKTVYATYTEDFINYTITYEKTMRQENPNPESYTINDTNIILQPLTNPIGMKFAGWYTDETYTTPITSIITANMENITVYAKWDIDKLMYFVKDTADIDNKELAENEIYDNFEDAKAYVDNQFNNGNGKAQGIYDLNNDLVYYPEVETKLYYVKENETIDNEDAIEYNDFDEAKQYVDNLFKEGTTIRIYDQNNDLVYEPKVEAPAIQYFVKENADDENTQDNTFDKFSESKLKADELFESGIKVKVYDINGEIVYEPQGKDEEEDKLYLRSTIYKIGENTPNEYDEGDELIYKVRPNTKLKDFIKEENLQTNGTIVVYQKDGKTPLGPEEVVGTGMILKDTKGEGENKQEIILPISVVGDTSGDGQATAEDLGDIVQKMLDNVDITLTKPQFKAIDMEEDEAITPADLADEIQLVIATLAGEI